MENKKVQEISNYYDNKTILITGGAGAIGSNLLRKLIDDCDCKKIIIIDDLSSGHIVNIPKSDKIIFIKDSILNDEALEKAFSHNVNVVFHLAAHFANQNSVEKPKEDLLVNGLGTLKILEFAHKFNVKKFVYSSSSCIYGNHPGPMSEESLEYRPDTPYAITKLLGERYVNFFHKHHRLNTVILRYFNSYGAGEFPGKYRNVIPNFLWLAMNKKPLPITGTGEETRDFTYVGDTIAMTLLAGGKEKAIGEVINIGQGRAVKIIDLAKKINEITKNEAGISFIEKRNWDSVKHRCASVEKAKNILAYQSYSNNIEFGIKEAFEWLKENSKYINVQND